MNDAGLAASATETQATSRAAVLMPALVDGAFDYLVPEGTPEGAIVEAKLAGRSLVGVVWSVQFTSESAASAVVPPPTGGRLGGGRNEATLAPITPPPQPSPCGGESHPAASLAKEIPLSKLKPITRVIEQVPPLKSEYRDWLDWVSEFTLAPKGAVLALCGLAHAAKAPKKRHAAQAFEVHLPTLTDDQKVVADAIIASMDKNYVGEMNANGRTPNPPMLLDGVTGSGKTETYFHAIAKAVDNSGQVLVLLPEISLTHQWLERFEKTFGTKPVMWHSRMTPVAKARAWHAVATGEVQVVVGARSALFLPFKHLSLIIVDEEHEASSTREDGVR
jgi:primosomal protein N' (replication factor Y)